MLKRSWCVHTCCLLLPFLWFVLLGLDWGTSRAYHLNGSSSGVVVATGCHYRTSTDQELLLMLSKGNNLKLWSCSSFRRRLDLRFSAYVCLSTQQCLSRLNNISYILSHMYPTHSQLLEESELCEPRSRESLSEAICRVMMTSMKLAAVIVVFP